MSDAEKAAEAHLHKTYFAVQNHGVLQRARTDFLAGYAARDAEVAELKTLVASYRATTER